MKTTKAFIYILIMMATSWVQANNLIITKSFTGGWYDPAKNGQGFLLEIIKSNNQKMALTTWFTFDTDGNQYWLIGVGEITGQSINFQMIVPEGGQFGDLHDPNNISNTPWGEVQFNFTDCNNGTVSWNPTASGFNAGSMPVTRNTIINNLNCTGGWFDELGDTITETEIITPLLSTGLDADANGKTKYEQRTDRIDYSVEIEDLPVGIYQLFVGDEFKGDIEVVTLTGGSTEGEIEFRDPVEPGKLLLDFNPHNQIIDITQNGLVYLTSEGSTSGGNNGGNSSQNAPPFGDSETEIYMTNTGIIPLGQAKAELKQRADRVDFQIELEDVPLGFYDFNVDGVIQGVVEVVQTPTGAEGELEFRNPIEAGKELLDFNPLGALLTVTQGSDLLFTVNFPETPGGGNNGGDTGGGGGNNQQIEIDVDFTNTGVDADASGSVDYEVRTDRRDFKVEVEDLTLGTYQLVVGGQVITSFDVNTDETELEFRDPVEPGKLLLDFDPLNQLIEIKQGSTVYLSALLQ
ncbi:hypothetical protein [Marinicella litoralis]|uniref:Uncharacterized protein n=1 Tax=Marinicella litoralis TaxID=644220 RepID=A0A4V3DIU7_9GAMM|nr:hypothetical protein [Marinicella litoralis]TDR23581.1 hypothetical protein C8D91_0444 [Marinicella litoralis]